MIQFISANAIAEGTGSACVPNYVDVEKLTRHGDEVIQAVAIEYREQGAIEIFVFIICSVRHDDHHGLYE